MRELQRVHEVAREQLVPLRAMLPTLADPRGGFDPGRARGAGTLQDDARQLEHVRRRRASLAARTVAHPRLARAGDERGGGGSGGVPSAARSTRV